MSSHNQLRRLTAPEIAARKGREKIVCLTAYTAPMAELLDPHVDLLLVGDSVGMVLHGLPTTVGVTLEMMVIHGQAVMRGSSRALVVVDLPFGSYERSPQQAHQSWPRAARQGRGTIVYDRSTNDRVFRPDACRRQHRGARAGGPHRLSVA